MFTWKPIYSEIATKLLEFENDSGQLVAMMKQMEDAGLTVSKLMDQTDEDGQESLLAEIDPISFMGNFNRGTTDANRTAILKTLKSEWSLNSPLPNDYDGLPILNNMSSWLMPFGYQRSDDHVPKLWTFHRHCLETNGYQQLDAELFDKCKALKKVGMAYLTMGMFWCRPDTWIALDNKNRTLAKELGVTARPRSGAEYVQWLDDLNAATQLSPADFSLKAHLGATGSTTSDFAAPFDRLFRDDDHANQILDQFKHVLGNSLHADEDTDQLACTIGQTGESAAWLQLTYGPWVVFRYDRSGDDSMYHFLWSSKIELKEGMLGRLFEYGRSIEDANYFLASVSETDFHDKNGLYYSAFAEALIEAQEAFAEWDASYGHLHTYGLIDLAVDENCRHQVLREGIDMPERSVDYWLFAPGMGARLWSECKELNIASMGWDDIGDLDVYDDKDAIAEESAELFPNQGPKSVSSMLWEFANEMKAGDVVFAKKGLFKISGWGVVTGEYKYDEEREEHLHTLQIDWRGDEEQDVTPGVQLAMKTLTRYTKKRAFLRHMATCYSDVVGLTDDPVMVIPPDPPETPYTKTDALKDLFLPEEKVDQIVRLLRRKKNIVLQGAPGTGKTFIARRLAYLLLKAKDESRVPLVQFHHSTTYEDFIQGYRPGDDAGFELKNGNFFDFVRRAQSEPNSDFVYVIDEINRGNLSKVFGELMMLIEPDKRAPEFAVPLTYASDSDDTFYVPSNVHLIGTMNTADRSLSLVDYALRRRFAFIELDPGFDSDVFEQVLVARGATSATVVEIRQRMGSLNKLIADDTANLGRGYRIGHSFFVPDGNVTPNQEWMDEIIHFEVLPLIEEYWCDDVTQLAKARSIALGSA